ncbi:MAG: hypothetical protein Q9M36_14925 [Sulfurovum sp.]|nr:hypothetical protein [Sulfurovum sp.]
MSELFNNQIILEDEVILFLEKLIAKTKPLMKHFKEEFIEIYSL